MAKPRKLSSIIRSANKQYTRPTGWFYPNQRKLLVKIDRFIRGTYDAYYVVDVPEDVNIEVRAYHSENADSIDVSSIGRIIFEDMNVFAMSGITKFTIWGKSISIDHYVEHTVEVSYKNNVRLSLRCAYVNGGSNTGNIGDLLVQGTQYWEPGRNSLEFPWGGADIQPTEIGFGGWGNPDRYEEAMWG